MDQTPLPPPPPPPPPAPVNLPAPPSAIAPQFAPQYGAPVAAPTGHVVAPGLPPGVTLASPWLRLGAYLLEGVLSIVTLGIGWLIWAAMTAGNGQTPAKKLLGLRVIKNDSQRPAGFATMLFLRGLIAGIVASLAITFTLGILLFMPFWDKRRQNIWDKVSGTVVVNDPNDAWRLH